MELQQPQKKKVIKKKLVVNTTLSPHLVKKMDRLVYEEEFSSRSDCISIAVTEFLVRFPDKDDVIP